MTDATQAGFRTRKPEEEELARLRSKLDGLKDELADRELELATRRRILLDFQRRYLAVVGIKLAELDRLVAEIAALEALRAPSPEAERQAGASAQRARESAEALGDDPDALRQAAEEPKREIPEDLKRLYRKAAKAVHPDYAADEEDRVLRERAMAEANAAYEAGDVEQLQAILDDWENSPDAVSGDGTGADLVRVIRAIAAVEARLAALSEELVACAESSLAELYAKAQIAEAEGRDLLQELAQDVDRQIAEARQRLAELSGDLESVRG
ncbi:MAG: molecular chaperone DnaJ [Acidobacteriota bacterium]|nr:molecular chaperone DnaJ [Acidobacteriota bacterium]